MNQSQDKTKRSVTRVGDIGVGLANKSVWIRARLHTSRAKGKQCFVVLRQGRSTIQGIIAVGEKTSKQLLKFVTKYEGFMFNFQFNLTQYLLIFLHLQFHSKL